MSRSARQKLKLFYLRDYLLEYSDEEHPITLKQMIAYLAANDISAERKSLYSDLELLREYGMDIIRNGRNYYVASREFELPELKLLVDSVQSSKFITQKKTSSLIRKIEKLASIYEAQLLNRQVYVMNRIKSMNESIYYNVDNIHNGIAHDRKIRFRYFEYDVAKHRVFRKNGSFYEVSPYAMTWDDENYYMVGFDSAAGIVKHYRVDKMTEIVLTEEMREGHHAFAAADIGIYARKVFGMFSGQEQMLQLRFANHLVGVVIDRFGKEVIIVPDDKEHFIIQVHVVVSPQFFGWLCAFGGEAELLSPADVTEQMRRHVLTIYEKYERHERHRVPVGSGAAGV